MKVINFLIKFFSKLIYNCIKDLRIFVKNFDFDNFISSLNNIFDNFEEAIRYFIYRINYFWLEYRIALLHWNFKAFFIIVYAHIGYAILYNLFKYIINLKIFIGLILLIVVTPFLIFFAWLYYNKKKPLREELPGEKAIKKLIVSFLRGGNDPYGNPYEVVVKRKKKRKKKQ